MKRSSLLQCIIGAMLAFLFSLSAIGQLVTGLDLAESVPSFIPLCALFSLVCAALFYFKYGWCTALLLTAGAGSWMYRNTSLADQISSFLRKLTSGYQKVYGVKILGHNKTDEYELVLILIAFLTAAAVSLCICRRKRIYLALAAAALPMALCLPVKLTQPDAFYLYLSMVGIVMLLITDRVRRNDPKGFLPLTLRASVAAALALALLFTLVPEDGYVNRAAKMNEKFESLFESSESPLEGIFGGSGSGISAVQSIDLQNLVPLSNLTYTVMTVESTFDGPIYLRGRGYDKYNGISWVSSEGRRDTFNSGASPIGMLTVTTSRISNVVYFPYYPVSRTYLLDGFLQNKDNKKKYTFTVTAIPVRLNGYVPSNTDLAPETYEWARALVTEITDPKMTTAEKIESIREYVSNSAVYDRSTASMGNAGNDFAKWFLFESETGYCAHYATAATVLLRAAGIPARYVEGYFVQCRAGAKTTVTNRRAHAWAEYYDVRAGVWQVLEVTPAEAFYEDTLPEDSATDTEPPVTEETEAVTKPPITEEPQLTEEPQSPEDTSDVSGEPDEPGGNDTTAEDRLEIPKWTKTLLWSALALAVIVLQASIRRTAKRERWNGKIPNETALARWRQCEFSAKMTQTAIPDKLEDIALKAKFSQHTVSGQELAEFEAFRKKLLVKIKRMPWYKRLVMRWVFAIG